MRLSQHDGRAETALEKSARATARAARVGSSTLSCLALVWGGLIAAGSLALTAYSNRPGPVAIADVSAAARPLDTSPEFKWPEFKRAGFKSAGPHPTLLVFIHPLCPCSQATLSELERLQNDVNGKLQVEFFLGCPRGAGPQWLESKLANRCRALPNATVQVDWDGAMASEFGATTSGYCLLFEPTGGLLFQGGVTPGRAHEGTNLGRSAIRALVLDRTSDCQATATFGCPLVRESQSGGEKQMLRAVHQTRIES